MVLQVFLDSDVFFQSANGVAMYVFLDSDGFFNLQSGVAICRFS